ncbi:putative Protein kinase [Leptomonas seymouri]|uniref:Protein kinase domain-containing protein n=1 Tax=Leptomonas seymouri TaxID=5684 RepID=A0A0N1PGK3_LEPSE|nr:putative Protein kinase [Leptomonas seymouri]|eukprot:KPI90622.1 putative Protein kinase [Leptomonas seymouri]
MGTRVSAELTSQAPTAATPLVRHDVTRIAKTEDTHPLASSVSAAVTPHFYAFDALLLAAGVVSILLVVVIVLLIVVIRLLRRASAAHRSPLYLRGDDAEQEGASSGTAVPRTHDFFVDEERPLLQPYAQMRRQQQQQQRQREGEAGVKAYNTHPPSHANSHRAINNKAAFELSASPSVVAVGGNLNSNHRNGIPRDVCDGGRPAEPPPSGAAEAAAAVANAGEHVASFRGTTQKDLTVFHTTHDSSYRLLQRIGMGAFSSVYLVQHKATNLRYAMKYIVCRDDRERLAALRECEVAHCLQGHPQVIRIADMFMNYRFQRGGGGSAKAARTASSSATQYPANALRAATPAAATNTCQSSPWEVAPAGNVKLCGASSHAARSLTQPPRLWARPVATPISPLSPVNSQQQQQQRPPLLSPLVPPVTNSPQLRVSAHAKAAATAPVSPSSPIQRTAAATTWVGVKLSGRDGSVMENVASASKLADDEVVAALRARIRATRCVDFDNGPEGEDALRKGDSEGSGDDSAGSGDSEGIHTTHSEAEGAPLILSVTDTERLLMDARLLQQRRRRRRAQSHLQRHNKEKTQAATISTAATAAALHDLGEARFTALSPFQQPKPHRTSVHPTSPSSNASFARPHSGPPQGSRQTFSSPASSSSTITHGSFSVTGQPSPHRHNSLIYGGRNQKTSGATAAGAAGCSSCGHTFPRSQSKASTEKADIEGRSHCYKRSSVSPVEHGFLKPLQWQQQVHRHHYHGSDERQAVTTAGDMHSKWDMDGSSTVTGGVTTAAAPVAQPSTAVVTPTRRPTCQSSVNSECTREGVVDGHDDEDHQPAASTHSHAPPSFVEEGSMKRAVQSAGQHSNAAEGSSYSSSDGMEEEPLQPIRRILVPPPSFMHPQPSLAVVAYDESSRANPSGNATASSAQQVQQPLPMSYVARSRYANFTVSVSGVLAGELHPGETATTAAVAAETLMAPASYVVQNQLQQPQPTPIASSCALAESDRTPATTYAPTRADAGTTSVSARIAEGGGSSQYGPAAQTCKDFSCQGPTEAAAVGERSDPTAPAEANTEKGTANALSPSTVATPATSTSADVDKSGSNTYGPARVSHYINPYLERARGGEVVPPPRTSYAPGGGVRYNCFVTPSTNVSTPPASKSPPQYNGPAVRAWNDGASSAAAVAAAAATASPPLPAPAQPTTIMRSTYAPLRYGNVVEPAMTATPEVNELRALTPPPAPLVSSLAFTATRSGKSEPGRLSVSAAIRNARADQQGERTHLSNGAPHVYVPKPQPVRGIGPPRPFGDPNESNRTHVVHGHSANNSDSIEGGGKQRDDVGHSSLHDCNNMNKQTCNTPFNAIGDTTVYDDAPSPQKPLYTNLGVALTETSPVPATVYRHTTATAHNCADTMAATPCLFRGTSAAVTSYGAVDVTNNSSPGNCPYAPKVQTYAPVVRYANAGNPTLWCAYGQPGGVAAIGPASVADARASAAISRDAQSNAAHNSNLDADSATGHNGGGANGHAKGDGSGSTASSESTTQSNSSGSLTQDIRDTGYLCLVMEYHPMGDLCHYVLRAKQQFALQQEQQQQSQSCTTRRSVSQSAFDSRPAASLNAPMSSDHSSTLHAVGALSNDMNSPTTVLNNSTASWIAAAAAATWRAKPAASKSDPNLAMAAAARSGSDMLDGSHRHAEEEKPDPTSRNPLTEPQLLSIAFQLSSVLDHMHQHNPPIIHRDLKPENILIKGELTEFLEDVSAEMVTDRGGRVSSSHANKLTNLFAPAAGTPTESAVNNHDSANAGGAGRTSFHERGAMIPPSSFTSSHHGGTASTPATAATALHTPPPIRITRAIIPIVLTDFGLAMVQETHGGTRHSRGGGTQPYIAPECWQGATCTASDMWSLGCVLYALATGRLTANTVRLMSEEAKRDGFASRMLNDIITAKYSLAFASFVVSLLVVDPAKRPTAAQAAQCFLVAENEVRFDVSSPFFSNVLDL